MGSRPDQTAHAGRLWQYLAGKPRKAPSQSDDIFSARSTVEPRITRGAALELGDDPEPRLATLSAVTRLARPAGSAAAAARSAAAPRTLPARRRQVRQARERHDPAGRRGTSASTRPVTSSRATPARAEPHRRARRRRSVTTTRTLEGNETLTDAVLIQGSRSMAWASASVLTSMSGGSPPSPPAARISARVVCTAPDDGHVARRDERRVRQGEQPGGYGHHDGDRHDDRAGGAGPPAGRRRRAARSIRVDRPSSTRSSPRGTAPVDRCARRVRHGPNPTRQISGSSSTPQPLGDEPAHLADEPVDVVGRGARVRLDEVGVHGGDPRAADPQALQARELDQPPRRVARRVLEDRPGVAPARLVLPAPGDDPGDRRCRPSPVARIEGEARRHHQLLALHGRVPVGKTELARGDRPVRPSPQVDEPGRDETVRRLANRGRRRSSGPPPRRTRGCRPPTPCPSAPPAPSPGRAPGRRPRLRPRRSLRRPPASPRKPWPSTTHNPGNPASATSRFDPRPRTRTPTPLSDDGGDHGAEIVLVLDQPRAAPPGRRVGRSCGRRGARPARPAPPSRAAAASTAGSVRRSGAAPGTPSLPTRRASSPARLVRSPAPSVRQQSPARRVRRRCVDDRQPAGEGT